MIIYRRILRNLRSARTVYLRSQASDPLKYLLLAMPITAFGLGTWQVHRRSWKLNLLRELHEKTTADPIDFPADLSTLQDLEYRRVRVRGKFDYERQMFLTPRSLVTPGADESAGAGLISAGQSDTIGSWVVTPFHVTGSDVRILVNRGWVPRQKVKMGTRTEKDVNHEIELIGVVRMTENRPPFGSRNDPKQDHWHYRDIDGMAERLGTAPVFLDADASLTMPGGPIAGQTRVSLRNEHFSYIITWYGLSVCTAYFWYIKYGKALKLI